MVTAAVVAVTAVAVVAVRADGRIPAGAAAGLASSARACEWPPRDGRRDEAVRLGVERGRLAADGRCECVPRRRRPSRGHVRLVSCAAAWASFDGAAVVRDPRAAMACGARLFAASSATRRPSSASPTCRAPRGIRHG